MSSPNHFFTSDWHLDHKNILLYSLRTAFMTPDELAAVAALPYGDRTKVPFSKATIDRMNDAIIENINAVVGPDDILWNLGDVIFGNDSPEKLFRRLKSMRNRLKCRTINLIWGNHDKLLEYERPNAISREQFHEIFNEVHAMTTIGVGGRRIVLNHYAMAVWEGSHRGAWHLYGHSHGNFEAWREEHLAGARMIDVGVDAKRLIQFGERPTLPEHYAPWSFDELARAMDARQGAWVDHHGAG